jgi:hypothetical protein
MTETAPESKTLTCTTALTQAYNLALAKLPEATHGRLAKGLALVQQGGVFETGDGYFEVASQREGAQPHRVTCTTCDCDWAAFNPGAICSHMAAVMLMKKSLRLLADAQTDRPLPAADAHGDEHLVDVTDLVEGTPAAEPHEPVPGIDPRYVVTLHGKDYVLYTGLVALAHQRGLRSLKAEFISVSETLALAKAEAVFADGRVFQEASDSSPENVGKTVRPHWPRMALVRAKARCLRDALAISACSMEELGEAD